MKKKVRLTLYIVGVLWIAVISQIIVNKAFVSEKRIMDAFIDSDTDIAESKINVAIDYGKTYLTKSDKEDLIAYFADAIGLDKDYKVETEKKKNTTSVSAKKKSKNADTSIEVISVDQKLSGKSTGVRQFILVELGVYEKFNSILDYKNKLEKATRKLSPQDYQCITKYAGTYDGQLSKKQRDTKVQELLDKVQARVVDKIDDGSIYTVYAYTGLVEDYVKASGKRININIVVSYDEEEDKTNISLATPLLNDSY